MYFLISTRVTIYTAKSQVSIILHFRDLKTAYASCLACEKGVRRKVCVLFIIIQALIYYFEFAAQPNKFAKISLCVMPKFCSRNYDWTISDPTT